MNRRNHATTARAPARRRLAIAAGALAGVAAIGVAAAVLTSPAAIAATAPVNCQALPSACGYPDATNSGVPAGRRLLTVPAQVAKGPGWAYSAKTNEVDVTGAGAVLAGLSFTCYVNIQANNVTLNDDSITTDNYWGVALRHTTGATVENSTIAGMDATTGEVGSAIDDVYGDSTGMTVKNNNISAFKTAIQISTGLISGNYIHNPGFVAGDHTNGILDIGTTQPLTITANTILDSLNQTDAISLDATLSGQVIANKTVTGNLIAGGSYPIYGGTARGATISHMTITGNRFGQGFYTLSGLYGPVAYYTTTGTANTWTGNTYDTTGATIPAPSNHPATPRHRKLTNQNPPERTTTGTPPQQQRTPPPQPKRQRRLPQGQATLAFSAVPAAADAAIKRPGPGRATDRGQPRLGDGPLLVAAAVAGQDLQLGAVGEVEIGIVQALAGYRVDQRAAGRLPLLIGAAMTRPQLDRRMVTFFLPVDIQALAVDLDRPVGFDRPGLPAAAVAGPHHHGRVIRLGAAVSGDAEVQMGGGEIGPVGSPVGVTVPGVLTPESPAVVWATTVTR